MSTQLKSIEETLIEEREAALETFTQKMSEAEFAATEYNRMDSAIAALTGGPKEDAVTALQAGRNSKSKAKKNATKEQVLPVLKIVVKENPDIEKADAEKLTKQKLKESGLGIIGASSQIRRYLENQPFQTDELGRVSIA